MNDKILICMFDMRLVGKDLLRAYLTENPVLGFDYDLLHYEPSKGTSFKIKNDEQFPLENSEIEKVEAYINSYPYRVWAINDEGICTGETIITQVVGKYAHCPPPNLEGHYWYNPEKKQWDYIYGVDENGNYIGNVPYKNCTYFAHRPAGLPYEKWDNNIRDWYDSRTLQDIKNNFLVNLEKLSSHAQKSGVLLKGHVWRTSNEEIQALKSSPIDTKTWVDFFGEVVELDDFTVNDIVNKIDEFNAWIAKRKEDAILKLNDAKTKEEVYAIEW